MSSRPRSKLISRIIHVHMPTGVTTILSGISRLALPHTIFVRAQEKGKGKKREEEEEKDEEASTLEDKDEEALYRALICPSPHRVLPKSIAEVLAKEAADCTNSSSSETPEAAASPETTTRFSYLKATALYKYLKPTSHSHSHSQLPSPSSSSYSTSPGRSDIDIDTADYRSSVPLIIIYPPPEASDSPAQLYLFRDRERSTIYRLLWPSPEKDGDYKLEPFGSSTTISLQEYLEWHKMTFGNMDIHKFEESRVSKKGKDLNTVRQVDRVGLMKKPMGDSSAERGGEEECIVVLASC